MLTQMQISGGLTLGILNIVLVQSGVEKPAELRTHAQDSDAMRLGFVCKELYTFTLMTIKFAICAFYTRIFQDKGGRLFIYSVAGFVILSTIPIMVAHCLRCDPPAGSFKSSNVLLALDFLTCHSCLVPDPSEMPSRISHRHFFGSLQHSQRHRPPGIRPPQNLQVLLSPSPFLLEFFPLPHTPHTDHSTNISQAKLQMARRQKFGLIAVLSLSLLIIVAAIVRAVRVVHEIESTVGGAIPYESYDITVWTSVEINTALFCAAAPSLKPLIQRLRPGMLGSHSHSSGESRRGYGTRVGGNTRTLERSGEVYDMGSQVELGHEGKVGGSRSSVDDDRKIRVCEPGSRVDDASWDHFDGDQKNFPKHNTEEL